MTTSCTCYHLHHSHTHHVVATIVSPFRPTSSCPRARRCSSPWSRGWRRRHADTQVLFVSPADLCTRPASPCFILLITFFFTLTTESCLFCSFCRHPALDSVTLLGAAMSWVQTTSVRLEWMERNVYTHIILSPWVELLSSSSSMLLMSI